MTDSWNWKCPLMGMILCSSRKNLFCHENHCLISVAVISTPEAKNTSREKLICNYNLCALFSKPDRTGPGGWTVKIENRDENRLFKPKKPDFLLIPWTVKTGVGPLEPVRTVRSNPLAIFFFFFFIFKKTT